jgi:hypothetical protein
MAKTRNYTYVITIDTPMWPRKIADELSFARGIHEHLVSVTDLQNDTHIYGDTYYVREDDKIANMIRRGLPLPKGWFPTEAPRSTQACTTVVRNRRSWLSALRDRPGPSRRTTTTDGGEGR